MMKTDPMSAHRWYDRRRSQVPAWPAALLLLALAAPAHASIFKGETLDAVANGIAWVALVLAPIVGITVFWLLHILPEKIAYKRHHPQAQAIHTLCLLSLFFGGLLWPIAWLWAYSKPVLYKMAYGTDKVDPNAEEEPPAPPPKVVESKPMPVSAQMAALEAERVAREAQRERDAEIARLREDLADLRRTLAARGTATGS